MTDSEYKQIKGQNRLEQLGIRENVMPRSDRSMSPNNKNHRWLVPVVIGLVVALFTSVTVAMWINTSNQIRELSENTRAVVVMQDNQKEIMKAQKELLENHYESLKENVDYIRDDIKDIKAKIDKINDNFVIKGGL